MARNRAYAYLNELMTNSDNILSDDDLCGAAEQATRIYEEHTSWTFARCSNRAWKIAEPIYAFLKLQNR
jgi:hypothetical protein